MALTVGVDSYVTIEEADAIIAQTYVHDDAYRVKWASLTAEDKEALLRASTAAIDALKFVGTKRDWGQKLQFPRIAMTSFIGVRYGSDGLRPTNQYYDTGIWDSDAWTDGGMAAVKKATADNALVAASIGQEVRSSVVNAIKGLKSKSVGPISESYDNNGQETRAAKRGIYSQQVYAYLNCWLSDSYLSF
jgi:hypothetical protein